MIDRSNIDPPKLDRPKLDRQRIDGQAFRKIKLIYRVAADTASNMVQRSRRGRAVLAGMREYGKYQSGHAAGPGRLVLAVCFTVSFIWFGVSSFWRVKKRAKG